MPLFTYVLAYKKETYLSQLSRSNFKGFVSEMMSSVPDSALGGIDARAKKEMTSICYGLKASINRTNVWEASGRIFDEPFNVYAVETVK